MTPKRDKEATKERLIKAVGQVLASEGFDAVGVNRVAKQAEVDKVLIYRYFGGLDQLVLAYGRGLDFWPGVEEQTGGGLAALAGLPLRGKLNVVAKNFMRGLLRRPLTLEILAWETARPNKLSQLLSQVREQVALEVFQGVAQQAREENQSMPEGVDLAALAAVIGAGVTYLAVRSRDVEQYVGVDIRSRAGWARIKSTLEVMIAGLLP